MKIIKGIFNIGSIDYEEFSNVLTENIKVLQDDNQEVEVQYRTTPLPGGEIFHSTLVLGRVDK